MLRFDSRSDRNRVRSNMLAGEPISLSRAVFRRLRRAAEQLRSDPSAAARYAAKVFRFARQSGARTITGLGDSTL
jgi:hypothetical protein